MLMQANPSAALPHLGMAITNEQLGRVEAARDTLARLPGFMRDSWDYIKPHIAPLHPGSEPQDYPPVFQGTATMLRRATHISRSLLSSLHAPPMRATAGPGPDPKPLVMEFGVSFGKSARILGDLWGRESSDVAVLGFDTFSGLPEAWHNEPMGTYSTHGQLPEVPSNVELIQGLFTETLPRRLEAVHQPTAVMCNIDCDLYSSTADVLTSLTEHGAIVPGSILVFDEYVMHDTWRLDEFCAWQDVADRLGMRYCYAGFSLATKQCIVEVVEV